MVTEAGESGLVQIKTACEQCHYGCGVIVHVRDGIVEKIEGDPLHPVNMGGRCTKALAYRETLYSPRRILYPMKKRSKGSTEWVRVSWDEALDTVAEKLIEVKNKYGPTALCGAVGSRHKGDIVTTTLFARALGTPNMMGTGYVCGGPGSLADVATLGAYICEDIGPDYENSKCLLIWGANPAVTRQPKWKQMLSAKENGAPLIVIDPRFTESAAKADIWLKIRPGTDAALGMGFLNFIINNDLYDKGFVEKWCIGFDRLKQRADEYPLRKVAAITEIPQEKIAEVARLYATNKPAVLHRRLGLMQQANATQSARICTILVAITGNVDVEGGNLLPQKLDGLLSMFDFLSCKEYRLPAEIDAMGLGVEKFPLYSGPNALAGLGFTHNPTAIKAMLTGEPYPIKALYVSGTNLVMHENSAQVREALLRLEFMAAVDFFLTPTTELADIFLPAATWVEKDDICDMFYKGFIGVRRKAIEPLGECRDDKDIIFDLARRMGLKNFIPWKDTQDFNDYRLKMTGLTFEDLKREGLVHFKFDYKKYETAGFKTPSGKIEIYSSIFKEAGYDPLPSYEEPPQSWVSTPELAKEYPLILITGISGGWGQHVFMLSEGRQNKWLREICPEPIIEIHPDAAAQRGIKDGDWVYIETSTMKKVKQKAKLTRRVDPRMISARFGWWYPEEDGPLHRCWDSNINFAISNDPPYDPIGTASVLRGMLCEVSRVQVGQSDKSRTL